MIAYQPTTIKPGLMNYISKTNNQNTDGKAPVSSISDWQKPTVCVNI